MTLCLPCCRSCLCKSPISLLTHMHVTAITQNRGDAIWLADFSLTNVRHMRALLNAYMQTTSWRPDQSLAILFFFFRPLSRRAVNLMSVPPLFRTLVSWLYKDGYLPRQHPNCQKWLIWNAFHKQQFIQRSLTHITQKSWQAQS